jgi:CheY-like chemotaxis protein
MPLFIVAVIIFIIADIIIRYAVDKSKENKLRKERESILTESIQYDFTTEAKSLKRAEVPSPKAKILCVDDEDVILDSFRKILVLDGYSIDTVNAGAEAIGLIKSHHYDFVFTDIKMPEMDGVEVTKIVKTIRPDIDVIVITGYATIENAVDTMKYGAMDYVQKPFTEDELLAFTKKAVVKRQERIMKELKPRVHISATQEPETQSKGEFAIPGGVFISEGHCWASIMQDGSVKIGIDDFAKKVLGKIEGIDFPNLGMEVTADQPIFGIKQGKRTAKFNSPVSGKITKVNTELGENLESLDYSTYDKNWICMIDASNLDSELQQLKIGKGAVLYYQEEIEKYVKKMNELLRIDDTKVKEGALYWEGIDNLEDKEFYLITGIFFKK